MPRRWSIGDLLRLEPDPAWRRRRVHEFVEAGASATELEDLFWMESARQLDAPVPEVPDAVGARVQAVAATLKAARDLVNRHRIGESSK